MNQNDFEARLRRQPPRQVPPEWRAEILGAARQTARSDHASLKPFARDSFLSTVHDWLTALLWPNPRAWATLAAVWVGIIAIQFLLRDKPETVAQKAVPPSPQVVVVLEQQKRLLAELIGQPSPLDAEPPKPALPRPRSERHNELLMA
jgi:hypothetical protein